MSSQQNNCFNIFQKLLVRIVKCRICAHNNDHNNSSDSDNDNDNDNGSDNVSMNLDIIDVMAQGGHGRVFQCRDIGTGRVVAMKQIPISTGLNDGVPGAVIREVSLLKELDHVNIVSLLKVGHCDNNFVNLVFEHLHCDLRKYIQDRRYPMDAKSRKSFMFQIVSAVAYCHSRKILHRDLKPSNVLVDDSRKLIKLADFGLAREFGHPDILYTKNTGTCWYRAPEILCNSCEYSTPVDLWSIGCIFAEIVIGQPLFQVINYCRDELEAIFRLLGTPTEEIWPGITQLMPNIHTYPKFKPLGVETFVIGLERDGLNLLSMMLRLNPSERISAEAALKHPYFKDVNLDFEGKSAMQASRYTPFP